MSKTGKRLQKHEMENTPRYKTTGSADSCNTTMLGVQEARNSIELCNWEGAGSLLLEMLTSRNLKTPQEIHNILIMQAHVFSRVKITSSIEIICKESAIIKDTISQQNFKLSVIALKSAFDTISTPSNTLNIAQSLLQISIRASAEDILTFADFYLQITHEIHEYNEPRAIMIQIVLNLLLVKAQSTTTKDTKMKGQLTNAGKLAFENKNVRHIYMGYLRYLSMNSHGYLEALEPKWKSSPELVMLTQMGAKLDQETYLKQTDLFLKACKQDQIVDYQAESIWVDTNILKIFICVTACQNGWPQILNTVFASISKIAEKESGYNRIFIRTLREIVYLNTIPDVNRLESSIICVQNITGILESANLNGENVSTEIVLFASSAINSILSTITVESHTKQLVRVYKTLASFFEVEITRKSNEKMHESIHLELGKLYEKLDLIQLASKHIQISLSPNNENDNARTTSDELHLVDMRVNSKLPESISLGKGTSTLFAKGNLNFKSSISVSG